MDIWRRQQLTAKHRTVHNISICYHTTAADRHTRTWPDQPLISQHPLIIIIIIIIILITPQWAGQRTRQLGRWLSILLSRSPQSVRYRFRHTTSAVILAPYTAPLPPASLLIVCYTAPSLYFRSNMAAVDCCLRTVQCRCRISSASDITYVARVWYVHFLDALHRVSSDNVSLYYYNNLLSRVYLCHVRGEQYSAFSEADKKKCG